MRGDTAEGGAKGCKARRSFPNVLQMVYASCAVGRPIRCGRVLTVLRVLGVLGVLRVLGV